VQLTLDAGQSVEGTVLDSSSGDSIPGAKVTLKRSGQSERTDTDREGHFTFQRVGRGTYQIAADAPGHLAQSRTLTIDGGRYEPPEQAFELAPAGSVSGEIVDRIGSPVWNAEVAAGEPPDWSRAVRTDHGGRFMLRNLAAGDVLVSARKGDASGESSGARVHEAVDSPGVIVRLDQRVPEDEEETSERDAPPADEPNGPSPTPKLRSTDSTDPRAPLGLARRGDAVVVERVAPGSSADRLGLRPGDVLAAINGETVRSPAQARGMLGLSSGRAWVIDVRRSGESLRLRYLP
jgi:membrane-associated protease RseP (regulator of RpoE activity)